MSLAELAAALVDIWLLGHTHLTYPDKKTVTGWKVFNPRTPEPDGLDCKHNGNAWIINIGKNKGASGDNKGFLVLDDCLVDLDPYRKEMAVKIIRKFAETHQVIFTTCSPETARELGGNLVGM